MPDDDMPDREYRIEQLEHLLFEREKELDALYRFATLFGRRIDDVETVIDATAGILQASMEFPERTRVVIQAGDHRSARGVSGTVGEVCTAERRYGGETVRVEVSYRSDPGVSPAKPVIDPRERRLISSTTALLADALERRAMELELRRSARRLQRQATELERKNVALREVLSQIEHEKQAQLRDARARVEMYVHPFLHQLADSTASDTEARTCIAQIESSLNDLFTTSNHRLVELASRLSPREVEISGLVRNGLTTKEISAFLRISEATVERHRNTIRRKLGLNGTRINLTSYLRSAR